ncbi:MAG TPA: ATP-binding cassette domain-containing protein, partial [Nitrospirae bacterium]|nr:ATP-binding cassette domain-containing protein [Nitrospirota bacterium]
MESYKRLSAYLRPYWWIIIIATLFSLVTSGLSGAIAWFVKPVLDGTLNKETGTIKIFLLVYISFLLLKSLSAFAGSYLMRAVGAKVVRDVREQLFNKLIYLPMNFFINKPSGDVISRVINDANVLQGVLGYVAKDILVEIPTFIALLAVAFIRGWDIALMACFVLPFSFYVIGRFGKKMKVIGRKTQEQISGLTVRLTESISGIKMIKAFVRQKLHLDKFDKENRKYYWIAMKGARTIEYSKLAQEIIGGIGLTLILFYGLNLIVSGRMSEGDLMSCFTALALMYTPVRRLGSANNSLQQARAAAERIFYMLDQEPEEDGTKELPVIRDNIEFSNFSFIYPGTDKKVIDNINLKVRKGELTAIVGKSGAGKTTLVDMIPRFYRPTEGKLLIDGTDINEATHKSLRINIGIVSQDVILFNESVRDNIALGKLDASDEEIADAAKAAY